MKVYRNLFVEIIMIICFPLTLMAQRTETIKSRNPNQAGELLFEKFKKHFTILDSLIFKENHGNVDGLSCSQMMPLVLNDVDAKMDSMVNVKTSKQIKAMKAETGLLISGQTYYRLDGEFGIDDDETAYSRYDAKVQVELRWNFLSSSLINRKSRIKELELKGELERIEWDRNRIGELIEKQKELFRIEYDSLLAGVLQLRVANLELLNDAQQYLVSDRSLSTDELLKIMDEQAIAERLLAAIPQDYPLASQLVRPYGAIVQVDSTSLKKCIVENDLNLYAMNLQIELLRQQEKSTNYWRTLNLSPFIRYSYYIRPELKNSSNVDAGLAFQIPLSSQESRKRKVLRAEQLQKTMEKEMLISQINENVNILLKEIERANRGLAGEFVRIEKMRKYIELRKQNYNEHIGEYNFISRIKEYNHYLTCWENYYSYQYKRDCYIAELQTYLPMRSVLEFCTIK